MSRLYRFSLLVLVVVCTLACGAVATPTATSVPTSIPPTNTASFTDTPAATNTALATNTIVASATPVPTDTAVAITDTVNPIVALQTQLVGTEFAQLGPMAHLTGFMTLYASPVGTPLKSWHDVPIMDQATAGQEFQSDIYSYKADATLKQAADFYNAQNQKLKWNCFPMATGSAGSGNQMTHNETFICGSLAIIAASYDTDLSHVLVVINKAP